VGGEAGLGPAGGGVKQVTDVARERRGFGLGLRSENQNNGVDKSIMSNKITGTTTLYDESLLTRTRQLPSNQ